MYGPSVMLMMYVRASGKTRPGVTYYVLCGTYWIQLVHVPVILIC